MAAEIRVQVYKWVHPEVIAVQGSDSEPVLGRAREQLSAWVPALEPNPASVQLRIRHGLPLI